MTPSPPHDGRLIAALTRADDKPSALEIARASSDSIDDAVSLGLMEAFNRAMVGGRSPVADCERVARAAAAVATVHRTSLARAVADRTAGLVEHLNGQSRKARKRLQRAADRFEEIDRFMDAGDIHRALIDVTMMIGDYTAAHRELRQAKRLYKKGGGADARRRGALAMNQGNVYHRRDELRKALDAYAEARRHYQKAKQPRLVAASDFNRANILATMDRTTESRRLYERAAKVFAKLKLTSLKIQADYALAGIDLLEGRLDASLQTLNEVKQRSSELGDDVGAAHAEIDCASALLRLNRSMEAEHAAQRAYTTFRPLAFDGESAECLALLAGASLQQGRVRKAATLFARGSAIETSRRNRTGAAQLDIGQSQALIRSGKATDALALARRSVKEFHRQGLVSREARARAVGADAALAAGRTTLANNWAQEALRLARSRKDRRVELAALLTLSRVDEAKGRPAAAYRRLLSAQRCVEQLRGGITTEESLLAFAFDKGEVYEALILNRLKRGDPQSIRQALVFAEHGKARALAERLSEARIEMLDKPDAPSQRLLKRLDRVDRELAVAESRLPDTGPGRGLRGSAVGRMASLTDIRKKTLRRLTKIAPDVSAIAGGIRSNPLAALDDLAPDEIVLAYTEAAGQMHLFVAEAGRIEVHPWLVDCDKLRDVVDLLRFQLGKGVLGEDYADRFEKYIGPALSGYFEKLHDFLLRPIADRLDGKRVRIVPHGMLHGLPFHAFERNGVALIERCVVSYSPSIAVIGLLGKQHHLPTGPPLVLGVPDDAAPMIENEVEEIQRQLPHARVLRGEQATSRAVRSSESHPQLLHVACHGFYSEHSAWTGALRLGDSWLSLPEIYNLRGTADLVILSGCETGRGTVYSGDEWVGLVRGFLQAGARSVVASLWEVQDSSAVTLMGDFYEALKGGADVALALAQAQRKALRTDGTPLRWAPFMVVGEPNLRLERVEAA